MSSRSYRNNNPGNLRFTKWTQGKGATDDGFGYAKFETAIQGVAAMAALLAGGTYAGKTIRETIAIYAPVVDNNEPDKYAAYVAKAIPTSIDSRLRDLDPYQFLNLLKAITSFEGWKP